MTKGEWIKIVILLVVAAALLAPWILPSGSEKDYELIHYQSSGGTIVLYLLDKNTGVVYQNRNHSAGGWRLLIEAPPAQE